MKKIINNKLYDTDKAKEIGRSNNGLPYNDFSWTAETLYRKKTGEYFLHGEGGANSRYAVATGTNSWGGGERIMPLSYSEAQEWAEKHLDGDAYIEIFGEPAEDDSRQTITLSLSSNAVAKAKQAAAKAGLSLSAYFETLI